MFLPPRDIVNKVKEQYPVGSRVELISMNDPWMMLQNTWNI